MLDRSKQLRIGVALGYIYTALQSVISILYIPILFDGIGKGEYGLYQIVGSIVSYFSVMTGPLSASILKYYSLYKTENEEEKMENTLAIGKRIFWILSVAAIALAIPLMFIFRDIYSSSLTDRELQEAMWMFGIMVANIVVSMNSYVYIAAINANESYIFLKLTSLILLCLQPIIVISVITVFPYAVIIVSIQFFLNIILSLTRYLYCRQRLKVSIVYHGKDKQLTKGIMTLSLTVLFVAITDQIFWKMDQLILGAKSGTEVVAVYSIGAQLNSMFISAGCMIGGMILPIVTRLSRDDTLLSDFFTKIGRMQSYIVCLILSGVILFGKEFILIIADQDSMDAYYVALLLMIPYSIDLIQTCGGAILQVKDKYYLRSVVMCIITVVNLILTFTLVNLFGMIGAAAATAISIIIGPGILMNYIYAKKIGLNLFFFYLKIAPIWGMSLLASFVGLLIRNITVGNSYLQFAIHIMLFIAVFLCTMYLVLNEEEKNHLLSLTSIKR